MSSLMKRPLKRVLFVCTGNTCRSPLAAAMFRSLAPAGYASGSCGTDVYLASPASGGALRAAKKFGLSIKSHRSRQVNDRLMSEADMVYCLTSVHAAILRSDYPDLSYKISVMPGGDVRDPFGGSDAEYLRCAEQIYAAVKQITDDIRNNPQ